MEAYYIPNGPINLQGLFPTVDFSKLDRYYLAIKDAVDTIATSTINEFDGECCDDKVRVHFLNYLGAIDAINFKMLTEEHTAVSEVMQKKSSVSNHATNRFNVKANEIITISNNDYGEKDQRWIDEIVDSPWAFIETKGIQGVAPTYIPIVILDTKILNRKQEERYEYEIIMQVQFSHEKLILRN